MDENFKKWVPTASVGASPTPQGKIVPNGPADKAGLKEGDIINQMDGVKYLDTDSLTKTVRAKKVGDKVTLRIFRGNEALTLTVELAPKE